MAAASMPQEKIVGDQIISSEPRFKDLWDNPLLKTNLICSCLVWLLSSFNFYLITFYRKKFPGSINTNSICFAFADMIAFGPSGAVLKFFRIS